MILLKVFLFKDCLVTGILTCRSHKSSSGCLWYGLIFRFCKMCPITSLPFSRAYILERFRLELDNCIFISGILFIYSYMVTILYGIVISIPTPCVALISLGNLLDNAINTIRFSSFTFLPFSIHQVSDSLVKNSGNFNISSSCWIISLVTVCL